MMLKQKTSLIWKAILFSSVLAASSVQAQFTYNNADLLVCFRNGGTYDFIVDAGPAATFATTPSVITISGTYYSTGSLNFAMSNTRDNVYFSAFGNENNTNILWATRARAFASPGTQSTPWAAQNYIAQGNTVSKIDGVGNSAMDYGSVHINPATNNTTTALVEQSAYNAGASQSFSKFITSAGNFNSFVGNIENLTPGGFSAGSTAVVSDLYRIIPTTNINGQPQAGAGTTWLGYFTFNPNGTVTFTPASLAPPSVPVITSFKRTGTTNKVTFTSGPSGTYSLIATNKLGGSTTNWPVIVSCPGSNGPTVLAEVTTSTNKFYRIKAQ
jgi:hypothetical protein